MLKHWKEKADKWYPYAFDIVRMLAGVVIFAKGVFFIMNMDTLVKIMEQNHIGFGIHQGLAQYIGLAHLAGGLMLTMGLITRLAAAVQIPILLGAVLLVHLREGFFSTGADLEFVVMLLIIHVILAVVGGGPLSGDAKLEQSRKTGANDTLFNFLSR